MKKKTWPKKNRQDLWNGNSQKEKVTANKHKTQMFWSLREMQIKLVDSPRPHFAPPLPPQYLTLSLNKTRVKVKFSKFCSVQLFATYGLSHGIFQSRNVEWVAISFSGKSEKEMVESNEVELGKEYHLWVKAGAGDLWWSCPASIKSHTQSYDPVTLFLGGVFPGNTCIWLYIHSDCWKNETWWKNEWINVVIHFVECCVATSGVEVGLFLWMEWSLRCAQWKKRTVWWCFPSVLNVAVCECSI